MTTFFLNMMQTLRDRQESGQGTLEYLGIAVVIGIIVVAVASWFNGTGTNMIESAFNSIIEEVSGDHSTGGEGEGEGG